MDDHAGDRGTGQGARVEEGMQSHQRRGVVDQTVRSLRVHGRVDGATGHLGQDQCRGEGPFLVHERQDTEQTAQARSATAAGAAPRPGRSSGP